MRRVAILGTGALGGYYGGLLAKAGIDVHFLAHRDVAHLREHGLQVDSKDGNFHLPDVHAYGRADEMPRCDLVIVALKTTRNALLESMLPPVLGDDGIVLVLQNGLCPEADAAAVVGPQRVLGGCCFLCSNKVGPGKIQHLDYGAITLGEYVEATAASPGITTRLAEVASMLRQAGIRAVEVEDLWHARWNKLVWNIPFNGLSVALDAATDEVMRFAEPLAQRLMEEVVAAAAAHGHPLDPAVVPKMLENTRNMVPYDSSMRLDWKRGDAMELEAIFGAVVRTAHTMHQPVPTIEMLYWQLRFLEQRRQAAQS